jgi:hypothetical protein
VADDAHGRPPGDSGEPTQEHRGLPEGSDYDATLPPPSDPYVDDADVSTISGDSSYDTGEWDETSGYGQGGAPTWSGRAGVPEPGTRPPVPGEEGWEPGGPRGGGAWYLPVVLGIVLLLLLGLVGLGLWLGLRDSGGKPLAPASSAPATSAVPSPTRTATVAPTTPPPTTAAATVSLPDLSGVAYGEAASLLTAKGLVPQRVDTVDSTLPAGTVIRTDPQGPTDVPAGSTVRLFVAVHPPPTSQPSPSPTVSPSG